MVSLSLKKLVTCGPIRSFNYYSIIITINSSIDIDNNIMMIIIISNFIIINSNFIFYLINYLIM